MGIPGKNTGGVDKPFLGALPLTQGSRPSLALAGVFFTSEPLREARHDSVGKPKKALDKAYLDSGKALGKSPKITL